MAGDIIDPANATLFGDLCNVLEQIYKNKKKPVQEREKILSKFIHDFKIKLAEIVGKKNSSFFPVLRLLVPSYERERGAYNLKEPKLGVLLVKVLSLNKQSHDAQKLLNRALNNSKDCDFGNVAYFVLKSRIGRKTSNLTVSEVNAILDRIAYAEVGNKGPILDDTFSYVIRNSTPEQTKWFLRIILKDLKLGLSPKRILACFHPDAPEHYENFGNLSKVCEELEDGNVRPLEMGIQLFYAVSPMLSERMDVTNVADLPSGKTYQIEEKFDGERFQMHMDNEKFEYFSRKGFSFASSYGDSYDSGLLTPNLKGCFSASVTSFVLDGEMMGWDKVRHCFGTKGMAFDVKKLTGNSRFQPCFCAFDVLYYNGKSLVGPSEKGGLPLSKRLELLDTMFSDVTGVIVHSKRQIVKSSSDILQALNNAIDSQQEGIVVKDTDSYYIANKRNAGWYKIKPEYTDGVMDDLDLVIIGADAADNPRQGRVKSFLVACADSVAGEAPHRWICSGRVATGLDYNQRESIINLLERNWRQSRQAAPPPSLVFNRIKPDYWILPEHSICLQVRATELIRSRDFATEYTLRFPRVKRIRDDKPVKDAMTLDEFNKYIENQGPVVKMGTKRVGEDQIEGPAKTRKKRVANLPQVPDEFRKVSLGVEAVSNALQGRKLCILSDDEDCTREELIRIVESHGGKVVANPGPGVWCNVIGRMSHRVRSFLSSQDSDVSTTAWLRALPRSSQPCTLAPLDMMSMKRETRVAFARAYDCFGDSYMELIDEETLRKCFQKMDQFEPPIYLTTQEMLELDKELFGDNNPFSFLRPCCIHTANGSNARLALHAKMYGATLCSIESKNLTHIIVPKDSTQIKNIKENSDNVLVLSEEWLEQCFEEQKLVSETPFLL